jgi:hypothetical protein
MSIWARSQHGIEARVLPARLFASMRQKSAMGVAGHISTARGLTFAASPMAEALYGLLYLES